MGYVLDSVIGKIECNVICIDADNKKWEFASGKEASEYHFDKHYLIDSIKADEDKIIISLIENDKLNDTSWTDDKNISFF